ncbi:MAG: MarC family protein [Nitrospirae bacterium]|nr:MarC family protein [Nitrospirota bacterium]
MPEILRSLPMTFIPIFVAIDIFIVLPVFISITSNFSESRKKAVIRESIITAVAVSLAFVALGEAIFTILKITADDFKIAGGAILLVLSIIELIGRGKEQRKPHEAVGVVPIGVPLIVGPAVLATLLVLIDHYGIIPTVVSLVLNLLIVWLALSEAEGITRLIGKNGIIAISKVMAVFLASIAVMMIRIGVENIVR